MELSGLIGKENEIEVVKNSKKSRHDRLDHACFFSWFPCVRVYIKRYFFGVGVGAGVAAGEGVMPGFGVSSGVGLGDGVGT